MATYGKGQMLGAGIDPRMFVQDYSGYANAGMIQGQGYAQAGQAIGDIAKQFGEYKKQQAEQEKKVKAAELVAKAISTSFPTLAPMAQEAMFIMGDKNNPLNERVAAADAVESALNLGPKMLWADREYGLEQRKVALAERAANAPPEEDWRFANLVTNIGGKEAKAQVQVNNRGEVIDQNGNRYANVGAYWANKPYSTSDFGGDIGPILPPDGISPQGSPIGGNGVQSDEPELPSVLPAIDGTDAPIGSGDAWNASGENIQGAANVQQQPISPAVVKNIEQAGTNLPPGAIIAGGESEGAVMTPDQFSAHIKANPGVKIDYVPLPDGTVRVKKASVGGGPLVEVNTGEKRQGERESMIDKSLITVKENAAAAAAQKAQVKEVVNLLNEGVKTGFGQDVIMKGRRILGKDVANQEQFKAASGRIAMGFINLTKGAISDREMQYFTEVLAPNIGTTVEGNKKIAEFLDGAVQKAEKIEATITEGMRTGKSPFDIDQEVQRIRNESDLVEKATTPEEEDPEIKAIRERLNLK